MRKFCLWSWLCCCFKNLSENELATGTEDSIKNHGSIETSEKEKSIKLEIQDMDISSTIIRENLFKIINDEEMKETDDKNAAFKEKMKDLLNEEVIDYLLDNIENLFFQEEEIVSLSNKKGRVVSKKKDNDE